MTWIGLSHKTNQPLFPEEWNLNVDALDILYQRLQEVELDPAKLGDVYQALVRLEDRKKVRLLNWVINKYVGSDVDIFDSDVETVEDGRVRIRLRANKDVLVRVKWYSVDADDTLLAYLNGGLELPSESFNDIDFAVRKGDKVNVRVIPEASVTVFIFNIGET